MLSRAGGFTKSEIGAIKMQQDSTYVELSVAGAEQFLKKVGSAMMLEKGIRLTKLDGRPDLTARAPAGERPQRDDKPAWKSDRKPHRKGGSDTSANPRPAPASRDDRTTEKPKGAKRFDKPAYGGAPKRERPFDAAAKPGKSGGDSPASPVEKKKKKKSKSNG